MIWLSAKKYQSYSFHLPSSILKLKGKFSKNLLITQVLRNLEISLRTNNIEWVREFLDERNEGLDVLIDYLRYLKNESLI